MSLPAQANWVYDYRPEEGSEEAKTLALTKRYKLDLKTSKKNQMVSYQKFTLENGLRGTRGIIIRPWLVNILYDVGARDESPEQTGFAHLFEHLMFGAVSIFLTSIPNCKK
jgi:hypothetical protein